MEIAFVSPSPLPPGGGSAFVGGMVPALRGLGHRVSVGAGLEEAGLERLGVPVVDGLVLPSLEAELPTLVARDAVVVVHHVSAGAGRDAGARAGVQAAERRMFPALRRVVATSQPVADRLMAEFGVAAPVVLHPGWAVLPRSSGGAGCAILSVGVLTPRKGHGRLMAALARLVDLEWSLVIAGDAGRDRAQAAELMEMAARPELGGRVTILPDPAADVLERLWAGARLFATATAWEGYPAGLAEAMRRGIPVVAPRLPGIEAVIPAGAGVLYAPDDAATFGKCLRRAIFDAGLREELAADAWRAGCALPGWDVQARAFSAILEG